VTDPIPNTAEVSSGVHDELLSVQERRIEAMIAQDLDVLQEILGADLRYVHSHGRVDSKQSFLDLVSGGNPAYKGVYFRDVDVHRLGADAAVLRGTAEMHLLRTNGEEPRYVILFTDVYAKRAGRWEQVAWQATARA
jgi:hypothetical protein